MWKYFGFPVSSCRIRTDWIGLFSLVVFWGFFLIYHPLRFIQVLIFFFLFRDQNKYHTKDVSPKYYHIVKSSLPSSLSCQVVNLQGLKLCTSAAFRGPFLIIKSETDRPSVTRRLWISKPQTSVPLRLLTALRPIAPSTLRRFSAGGVQRARVLNRGLRVESRRGQAGMSRLCFMHVFSLSSQSHLKA